MPIVFLIALALVVFALAASVKTKFSSIILIQTSFTSRELANAFAKIATQDKLAACVSIYESELFYSWQDNACKDKEFVVKLQTLPRFKDKIVDAINKNQTQKNPQIIILEAKVYKTYYAWIQQFFAS
jgi:uncharacterized protein involved in tolerance to divalent cations